MFFPVVFSFYFFDPNGEGLSRCQPQRWMKDKKFGTMPSCLPIFLGHSVVLLPPLELRACDFQGQSGSHWLNMGKQGLNLANLGDGPNTVSESTVSNTEISEFLCSHRVLGRELSEFLSAYYLCAKASSPSSLAEFSVRSVFRNSTLETVF